MALQVKQGDLLANAIAPCIIIHGCNAQGKMASGFAAKLRNIYPDAYTAYKKVERNKGLELGEVSVTSYANGLIVANAVTQQYYGRNPDTVYVDYEAVEKALKQAAEFSAKHSIQIHLPFIGGGLANGDKDRLMSIFTEVFKDVDATLWIYKE